MLVAHTSPLAALGALFVPTVSAVAGAIGMGTSAPPLNAAPISPPVGAVAESASGRSAGAKALRATTTE
jgi:hypothetical protein